jgi:hypothetical protein
VILVIEFTISSYTIEVQIEIPKYVLLRLLTIS